MNPEELVADENTLLIPEQLEIHVVNPFPNRILGLFLMATSAVFFSIMSLLVKIAGLEFPVFQILLYRSLFQLIFGISACATYKINPFCLPGINKYLFASSALSSSISLAIYFFVLVNMPLGDGMALFFINPAFTTIAAYFIINEPLYFIDMMSVLLCLMGVLLVVRPEFAFGAPDANDNIYPLPVYIPASLAILAAFVAAIGYCVVRIIGQRIHYLVHVVWFGAISTIFSFIIFCMFETPVPFQNTTAINWIIFLAIGLMAFVGQCLLNCGLQHCEAGIGSLMRNLDVVFAFLFGLLVFGEKPLLTSIIGASLITGSTAFVAIVKWNQSR